MLEVIFIENSELENSLISMLVYSLVARGSVILAEHTQGSHTSAVGIAKDLLKKLGADKNSRKSVSHDMYTFSLITDEHLTFLVSSTESSPRLFSFLGDIKDRWYNTFGDKGNDAQMLAMNGQFSRTLQDRMVGVHGQRFLFIFYSLTISLGILF